jgi:cytoskeletal protein CcmA (bactofilin family)
MLGSKDKVGFGAYSNPTLISRDTEVMGDIKFSGNLDIEGVVRGNITALSGKDAVVRIVDKGHVEGEIRAPSVIINGVIVGDVYSAKHLELAAKAKVQGSVHYNQVEMAIGAEVNGSLKHSIEQPAPELAAAPAQKEPVREATRAERKQAVERDAAAAVKS